MPRIAGIRARDLRNLLLRLGFVETFGASLSEF